MRSVPTTQILSFAKVYFCGGMEYLYFKFLGKFFFPECLFVDTLKLYSLLEFIFADEFQIWSLVNIGFHIKGLSWILGFTLKQKNFRAFLEQFVWPNSNRNFFKFKNKKQKKRMNFAVWNPSYSNRWLLQKFSNENVLKM